jgi:hypothetical protein
MNWCFIECISGCYYYTNSCCKKDCMLYILSTPAHKQTNPAKYPGQIVNTTPQPTTAKAYKPTHGGYPSK